MSQNENCTDNVTSNINANSLKTPNPSLNLNSVSVQALSYLGDAVLEILVRTELVTLGISSSSKLNKASLHFVKASAQAEAAHRIMEHLSEDEERIFKRGRNISSPNIPKAASVSQYRLATGLETLFGYLHLSGNTNRIREIFILGFSSTIGFIKSEDFLKSL